MAMDKDVIQVVEGVAAAKTVQALVRKYGDLEVAKMFLYTPEQYVKDLKTAGYVVQIVDTAKTDAEIGVIVMQATGYTFLSGLANLRGSAKLTADPFTYRAAAGQKVSPMYFPSTWLSALLGTVGVADSMYDFLGMKKHKLLIAAAGSSLLGDGVTRALGVDGTITAPSGFDVTVQPGMQYLNNQGALQNLQKLSADNSRLQKEIASLRSATAQYPRGMPPGIPSYSAQVSAQQPVVQVSEIIPSKGAEAIKERVNMMGIHKATAETVKRQTGLVTLTGGR